MTDGSIATTSFRGRVFARRDAANSISFGISKAGAAAAAISYTPFNYSLGTTYLLIVKYTFVAGATNDTIDLFINPPTTGAEPAPTVSAPDITVADNANVGAVALRQGTAANAPTQTVDGIRVAASFANAVSIVTAAHVTVSGRVLFDGRNNPAARSGTERGTVTVTGASGTTRTVETGRFGSFAFADLTPGETYIIEVQAPNYNFPARVVTPNENLTNLTFEAEK